MKAVGRGGERKRRKVSIGDRAERQVIPLYNEAPDGEVTLQELEVYAMDRLKALRELEALREESQASANYVVGASKILDRYMPLWDGNQVRRDRISHYILRLAFCTGENRDWFVRQEEELLKLRLSTLSAPLNSLLEELGEQYEKVEIRAGHALYGVVDAVKRSYELEVKMRLSKTLAQTDLDTVYFKIPFKLCIDLVKRRRITLIGGYGLVPESLLSSIITSTFRRRLAGALDEMVRAVEGIKSDERISTLVGRLPTEYLGDSYSGLSKHAKGSVDMSQLDRLSEKAFPMCMRMMHTQLRHSHHLKHFARLQYGLFLKGIGVTLEQALAFWKREFCRKIPADQFDKQYAYHIRHSYGEEGRRANYVPFSCVKIITSMHPGAGEQHGCPYKHYRPELLAEVLGKTGMTDKQVEETVREAKAGRFGHACRKHFCAMHPTHDPSEVSINHPHQFYFTALEAMKTDSEPQ